MKEVRKLEQVLEVKEHSYKSAIAIRHIQAWTISNLRHFSSLRKQR